MAFAPKVDILGALLCRFNRQQDLLQHSKRIEDEGNHGNDETRLFILSSLAAQHKSRVACILCEEPMLVFDRYPLVDGTFFLSPKQHAKGCIEVKYENRVQYLTSVCMACLDGVEPNRACNNCFKLLLHPHQRLNFYSDYSHSVSCPYCSAQDTHFVKPLTYCYTKQPMQFNCFAAPVDAGSRQEQQSPFGGSSASCSTSVMAAGGGDKAVVDTAAMNSFIQELRHLSNSSTISSISSTSTDSGISTSPYGDSNVGSGLAAAITHHSHQQQTTTGNAIALIQQSNGKASSGMLISSGAVPKTGISAPPGLSTAAIWGNKSLWGPAPPSPSLTLPETTTPTAALVSPPVMKSSTILPAAVTSPTSNALYTSLSKEMYSPWSTSTPTAIATGPTPAGENNRNASPDASLPTQSLATKSSNTNTSSTSILSNTSTSIIPTDNNGTNIWDSKLGLFGTQQSPTALGSKWPAKELASVSESTLGSQAGVLTDTISNSNVWSVHTAASSGSSCNQRGISSYAAVGCQYALPQVSMSSSSITGGISIDNENTGETMNFTPKHLSALWSSNAQTSSSVEGVESNISVFKSMRLGGGVTPLFDFSSTDGRANEGGNSKAAESVGGGGGAIGEITPGASSSNDSPAVTLFSDEFMSYLNVFN
ncbi:hypothetical protein AND_004199 [Anopheles darlingi]|uniref:Headcase middle domain-containing protein n=1 Tax=Anopheles darlingi TaxID=43151 RepID=W5JL88_ANODA|nr:hypothetical protein AND_004199 [Anopheles darlingi]